MKKYVLIIISSFSICFAQIEINSVFENVASSTERLNETTKNVSELKGNSNVEKVNQTSQENSSQTDGIRSTKTDTGKAIFKAYQNYDFVAGEKILFEDNFQSDMEGEFPAHWDLNNGQAVVNLLAGKKCFLITDGNYCRLTPLIKNKSYLGSEFTLEFDYYPVNGGYHIQIGFLDTEGYEGVLDFANEGTGGTFGDKYLFGSYPTELQEDFFQKWHHVAVAYKNNQLKVYVDANRVLTMPNIPLQPISLDFHGIGNPDGPIVFTNVKIAEGGKMNMIDKVMTDGKIVTHGILFDVNKSSIKPESMGIINQIYQLLKDNADLKFEIGGYTDSDGDDNSNLKLSEQRARSVKEQLVTMGISSVRLSTKGYGEANPIDLNTTIEGKANNRRVEFVKH